MSFYFWIISITVQKIIYFVNVRKECFFTVMQEIIYYLKEYIFFNLGNYFLKKWFKYIFPKMILYSTHDLYYTEKYERWMAEILHCRKSCICITQVMDCSTLSNPRNCFLKFSHPHTHAGGHCPPTALYVTRTCSFVSHTVMFTIYSVNFENYPKNYSYWLKGIISSMILAEINYLLFLEWINKHNLFSKYQK